MKENIFFNFQQCRAGSHPVWAPGVSEDRPRTLALASRAPATLRPIAISPLIRLDEIMRKAKLEFRYFMTRCWVTFIRSGLFRLA